PHPLVGGGGHQHCGAAELGDYRAICLEGEFAGGQLELVATDIASNRCFRHECSFFFVFRSPACWQWSSLLGGMATVNRLGSCSCRDLLTPFIKQGAPERSLNPVSAPQAQ